MRTDTTGLAPSTGLAHTTGVAQTADASAPPQRSRLLDRLRRRTVSEKYIPGIDGLRFAAILSVVLFHITVQERGLLFPQSRPWPNPFWMTMDLILSNGSRGVPIFFAISGFILALPFARHHLLNQRPVSLSFYFLRRVTRLEPPYLLILLIRLPLLVLFKGQSAGYYGKHFLASVFYLHNLIYQSPSILNLPAWSLEIEIQFYCLVPLLALYFAWKKPWARRTVLLVFMAVMGVLQVVYVVHNVRASLSILYWLQYFMAGFLLADLYMTEWERIPSHWLWDVVALPLWFKMFYSWYKWEQAILPFVLLVLFIAAFKGPLQSRFFGNAWIAAIGGMCYSIYLTHAILLTGVGMAIARSGIALPQVAIWAVCLTVVLVGGTVFYLLVERPCMDPNWPKQLWRRLFPSAQATTDAAV